MTRENKPRYFYDLIDKRFDINNILKIQRKDDEYTISDKIFDFSSDTVSNLIKEGEKDALQAIVEQEEKEKIEKNKKYPGKEDGINNQLIRFIEDVKMTITEDDEYIIRCAESELRKKR